MEKIALITGASRGIGRATARRLAHEGYTVAVNYHVRQDCADSLVAELAAEGLRAAAFQADVADRAQVENMMRRVEDTFGPVSRSLPRKRRCAVSDGRRTSPPQFPTSRATTQASSPDRCSPWTGDLSCD